MKTSTFDKKFWKIVDEVSECQEDWEETGATNDDMIWIYERAYEDLVSLVSTYLNDLKTEK